MLFIFADYMHRKLISTLLIVILAFAVNAQDSVSHKFTAGVVLNRGFIIAHRPLIVPLQKDHINGIEASFSARPNGSKQWHHTYNFPEMGVSLAIWDLGNKNQLGSAISIIPYMDFPIITGKKSSFDLKFGWGIGYIEKVFDSDKNYKNVAIGSHLNCALTLQPGIKTQISKNICLRGGLTISHFSNGSITMPNLGINLVSVTAGLSYRIAKQLQAQAPLPLFVKSKRFTFFIAAGTKQIYPAGGKNYKPVSLSASHTWQLSPKSGFGFGADVFYDNSITQKLEEKNMELNSQLEAIRPGIHAGYELVIADLSVVINMGGYLYSRLLSDGTFYQRVGLRYRFSENIFALMHLKSHWGKADFIEWGLGYRIDKLKSR